MSCIRVIVVASASILTAAGTMAAERPVTGSVRMNALSARGHLYGAGLALSMRLSNGWFVTGTLDNYLYEPSALTTSPVARPQLESVVLGAAIGRSVQSHHESFDWFWSAGIAAGLPQGNGRQVDARLESGTQVHLTAALGGIRHLGSHWSLSAALRVERHYVDIRYRGGTGAETQRLSTLTPAGLYLSIDYGF